MSRYKLKIILWFTGLLTSILIAVSVSLYTILGYQLRQEIDRNILDKTDRIDHLLRTTDEPPPCDRRFLGDIIRNERNSFWDIREYTDITDDKFILVAYCQDSLMYLSEKYKDVEKSIQQFRIKRNHTSTILLANIPFSMASIPKRGYTIYVGYELSTIRSVQKRILEVILFIFPFGVILTIVCGYFVTQRSLKDIRTITNTTSNITSKNLSERIPVPSGKDEITQLILTLNSMIDRLEKSFIMVQQFSHDAAHEIRTPLTIIRGEIEELLKDDECSENISTTIESILEEIEYLSSIADKLLLIHSLDTSKIEYHFTDVNLDKIIEEIYEDASVLSIEKQLIIKLHKNDPVVIRGNEELLVRLLWNLIDNAIKYTPSKGKVTISLAEKKAKAVVTVTDTGIGIPKAEIPKIFDRFYRVDKSRSRELGGSGLGLAICKWIVELHHGQINVKSKVHQGSQFEVVLPLHSETV
ncbi:HAMP domain-containing protein [bacterium]|nr:HAMP domain-containing protein [bacterium]RQV95247.1 MAG: HAMP domain-containing protein [bacterium]